MQICGSGGEEEDLDLGGGEMNSGRKRGREQQEGREAESGGGGSEREDRVGDGCGRERKDRVEGRARVGWGVLGVQCAPKVF